MTTRKSFWRGMGLGALLAILFACTPPQTGGQTRMANTKANNDKCFVQGGTPKRDPQPPRPTTDPGPYFICAF